MIPIIDMHCDTISQIYELRRKGEDVGLRRNDLHLDLMRMKEAGFTSGEIEKIFWRNVMRVYEDVLG